MTYSFTEKKRIRKNFGKLPNTMDLPYLLSIQLDSYQKFTQIGLDDNERTDTGLHAALKSVFPIIGYSGNAALEYVDYKLGSPAFEEEECKLMTGWICDVLDDIDNEANITSVRQQVLTLCERFPVYPKS